MPLPSIPLASHRAFSASTVESLHAIVKSRLGAVCIAAPTERRIEALANRFKLPAGELWFCSYGEPVKIRFNESDYFRVQFQHASAGSTQIGTRQVEVAVHSGCVSSAPATLAFGAGFQQLVWRIDRETITRKLAALIGGALSRRLEFEPELDLSPPRARGMLGILHSTVHTITTHPGDAGRFMLSELEQALMVSLLTHGVHNFSGLLNSEAGRTAPWTVRRIEEFIGANLQRPFDIEDAVALTGCSARTIYRSFRRHRGYSPLEFSKQRRLSKARELLCDGSRARSVTEVAYECGFNDLSHFSRDFKAAFGTKPSAMKGRRG